MTAPIQPSRFDRSAAKRAGYSDAEIDDFLTRETEVPVKRQGDSITRPKSDSFAVESSTTPATHRPDVTGQPNDWPELVREVGRGATFGLSDRAEAGVRALGDETYSGARDEQKRNRAAFQGRNPITSAVANAAGGIATGGLVMKGMAAVPGVGRLIAPGMTAGSRIGSAAASGAIQGGVAGALSADGSLSDRAIAGGKGALVGGALSGGLSAAAEVLRGGARGVGGLRDAYRSRNGQPVPMNDMDAARELLPTLKRAGVSVEDLRAADATADPEDLLAELGNLRKRGVRTIASANRQGLRPEPISEALDRRAMDEAPRFSAKLSQLTGEPIRDASVVAEEARAAAKPAIVSGLQRAAQQPDITDPRVLDVVETLNNTAHGKPALNWAGELAEFKGTTTPSAAPTETISVENLHNLRQGIDREIAKAVKNEDGQLVAMLEQRRHVVDGILKDGGGPGMVAADAAHAAAMAKGESFALGERMRSGAAPASATDEGIAATLANVRDKEAFRQGAASNLQNAIRTAGDGSAGAVTNPVRGQFGSPRTDARTRLAFSDQPSFDQAKASAGNVTRRFATRNQVLGGSQTALNQADDDAELGAQIVKAAAKGKPGSFLESLWNAGNKGARGATLDRKARILLAGGGGDNLTRAEALTLLETARPLLLRSGFRQAGVTSSVGRLAGGAVGRPNNP
jgi:hypothetical protein